MSSETKRVRVQEFEERSMKGRFQFPWLIIRGRPPYRRRKGSVVFRDVGGGTRLRPGREVGVDTDVVHL